MGTIFAVFTAFCFVAALAGYLHGRDMAEERKRRQQKQEREMQDAFNEEGF